MFRTISIKTVRKENHKPIVDVPFAFSRGYELIKHNLCSVRKVTELSLPHGKAVRMSLCVTKFVAEHSKLRQVRVGGNHVSGVRVVENSVNWIVVAVFVLVEHMSMSV